MCSSCPKAAANLPAVVTARAGAASVPPVVAVIAGTRPPRPPRPRRMAGMLPPLPKGRARPSAAVVAVVASLLLDLDAGRALHILGIGRLEFRRRARLLAEWRGLCMALWRLALQRSFPDQAEAMFRQFRESFGQSPTDKTSALALERAPAYWEVLAERGDADFRPVSRFLAAVFFEDEARAQAMALRLMLHVRQTYQSIFDRLI